MKFSAVLAVAAMAAVSSAQISKLPACAATCLISGIPSSGCGTDFKCACSNTAFVNTSLACVQSSCTPAEIVTARDAVIVLCRENGVELDLPPVGGTPSTTQAPPASTQAPPASTQAPPASTKPPTSPVPTPIPSSKPCCCKKGGKKARRV